MYLLLTRTSYINIKQTSNKIGLQLVSRPVEKVPLLRGYVVGTKAMQTDRQTGLVAGRRKVP